MVSGAYGMRRTPGLLALALLVTLSFGHGSSLGAPAVDLSDHLWRDRLLILVAPSADEPRVREQLRALNARTDALIDRDLVIYELYERTGSRAQGQPLPAAAAGRFRTLLGARPGSRELILVGKDGAIKQRAPLPADPRDFLLQIDAMPMRQAEIRAKTAAGEPVIPP